MPRGLRDLGFAALFFAVVFAVSYVAGRAMLPPASFDLAAPPLEQIPNEPTPTEPPAPSLERLRALAAATEGSVGAAGFTGAVEGLFVLENIQVLDEFTLDQGSGFLGPVIEVKTGIPVNMNARVTGSGVILRVIGDGIGVGEPRSDDLTVVVNSGSLAFNATQGECTLRVLESSHSVRSSPVGGIPVIRSFVAEIECVGLLEIRDGGAVDFIAVFALDPTE